ncbi:hypothetical protein ACI8AG_13700 [Blastococcus sp. SYSU DS0552]
MELLLWLAAGGALLAVLALIVVRRQRRSGRSDAPHLSTRHGAPSHGSPSSNDWTFGGGVG